jgi:hypothetical protein
MLHSAKEQTLSDSIRDCSRAQSHNIVHTARRALTAARRSNAAFLLLVSLLAPYAAAFAQLAAAGTNTCGMSCCRRSGVCCCRKARHAALNHGPEWNSARRGGCGCRQLPAPPARVRPALAAGRSQWQPLIVYALLSILPHASRAGNPHACVLFGRPPPASQTILTA